MNETPEAVVVTGGAEPTKLPKEIVLELENYNLKMQNIQYQMQLMQRDLQAALKAKEDLEHKMEEVRVRVLENYKVDLRTTNIMADGTCTPSMMGAPRLQ